MRLPVDWRDDGHCYNAIAQRASCQCEGQAEASGSSTCRALLTWSGGRRGLAVPDADKSWPRAVVDTVVELAAEAEPAAAHPWSFGHRSKETCSKEFRPPRIGRPRPRDRSHFPCSPQELLSLPKKEGAGRKRVGFHRRSLWRSLPFAHCVLSVALGGCPWVMFIFMTNLQIFYLRFSTKNIFPEYLSLLFKCF